MNNVEIRQSSPSKHLRTSATAQQMRQRILRFSLSNWFINIPNDLYHFDQTLYLSGCAATNSECAKFVGVGEARELCLCCQCFPHQFVSRHDWETQRHSLLHQTVRQGAEKLWGSHIEQDGSSSGPRLGIKYWDSQTDRANLMLVVEWWRYITGSPARQPVHSVGKNQFSPSLVLGISTDLFKNTIYISFGQAGMGPGTNLKLIFVRDRQRYTGQHREELSIKM